MKVRENRQGHIAYKENVAKAERGSDQEWRDRSKRRREREIM